MGAHHVRRISLTARGLLAGGVALGGLVATSGDIGALAVGSGAAHHRLAPAGSVLGLGPASPTVVGSAVLNGVTAVTENDAWAVGVRYPAGQPESLVEHWNGNGWSVVSSPNPGVHGSMLSSVDAISADNVWAVGQYARRRAGSHVLVEHWNGSAWRQVPTPDIRDSQLLSVSAVSRRNVWAVGTATHQAGIPRTLAMRWNGTSWSRVATPALNGAERLLFAVSATGATDTWSVGAAVPKGDATVADTLAEHWNGQRWHRVSTPSPGRFLNELLGVSVVAPGNAWAVGDFANASDAPPFALVEHLTGGHWARATIPPLGRGSSLRGVSGDTPDDVWAVGVTNGNQAMFLHWNGHHWQRYNGPGPSRTFMTSVTTHSTASAFSVGVRFRSGLERPVQERWNGHVWTQ
jgi:hypothetical protein